jgi:hypothetical protein
MSELEIPERAWAIVDQVCCCRAHSAVTAAPIIVATYIRDRLMPDAEEVWLQAWLDMHARGLDPEGSP